MLKGKKELPFEEFMTRVAPYTDFGPETIEANAKERADDGRDFVMIVRDVEFSSPKDTVFKYMQEHDTFSDLLEEAKDGLDPMVAAGLSQAKAAPRPLKKKKKAEEKPEPGAVMPRKAGFRTEPRVIPEELKAKIEE